MPGRHHRTGRSMSKEPDQQRWAVDTFGDYPSIREEHLRHLRPVLVDTQYFRWKWQARRHARSDEALNREALRNPTRLLIVSTRLRDTREDQG